MPWKVVRTHVCKRPWFWWWKPTGSVWMCSTCHHLWRVGSTPYGDKNFTKVASGGELNE